METRGDTGFVVVIANRHVDWGVEKEKNMCLSKLLDIVSRVSRMKKTTRTASEQ
jgi:hypothetical protein